MQSIKPYILPAVILILFVTAYYPAFSSIISKWYISDDYTHAFFTVPIVVYMIWSKRHLLANGRGQPVIGLLLIIVSIFSYLISLHLQIPTITFIATVFSVISALIYFAGFRIIKEMSIPILLLFLIIPIPNQLLSMVTASLQLKVSWASEIVIQSFSVPIFREGNILHLPDKTFQVIEACSGIRSLITLMTLSIILGYFTLKHLLSVFVLFLCSIPIAIFVNIIRVVSLVMAFYFGNIDLTSGMKHTIMGVVLFGLGLAMLYIFQRILEFCETRK